MPTKLESTARIHIPASIDEAVARLEPLGRLLTAKEWERAAIVFAHTEPQQGRRNLGDNSPKLSIADFAALGIVGLKSRDSVRFYHQRWAEAMKLGHAGNAVPGGKVKLPDREWTPEVRVVRVTTTHRSAAARPLHRDYEQQFAEAEPLLRGCLNAHGIEWRPTPRSRRRLRDLVALAIETIRAAPPATRPRLAADRPLLAPTTIATTDQPYNPAWALTGHADAA